MMLHYTFQIFSSAFAFSLLGSPASRDIISLLGIFVALFLGLAGIFREQVQAWRLGDSLTMDCGDREPFYQLVSKSPQQYIARLLVRNTGGVPAEDVRAVLAELEVKRDREQTFQPVCGFVPIPMKWTHENERESISLSPKDERYLDFGTIQNLDPCTVTDGTELILATIVQPTNRSTRFPGGLTLRFTIKLFTRAGNKGWGKFECRVRKTWMDMRRMDMRDDVLNDEKDGIVTPAGFTIKSLL